MAEMRDFEGTGAVAENGTTVQHTKEQARRLAEAARQRAFRAADEKKGLLAQQADSLARTLEDTALRGGGDEASQLASRAAAGLRRLSEAIDRRSTDELLDMAQREMRNRPGLFLAGCLALGFLGARLFRS